MGWAGPAQPTGPDSAQNCWADLGPKWVGPISAQNKKHIIFWARPGPEDRAGPGSAWPKPKRGGGELFSPHPCMQNATRSACRERNEKINAREKGKKSYLARRRKRWLAAFLAVLWWRLVAVSLLPGGDSKQRRCCLKRRKEGFFLFPSPLFPSLFFSFFGFLSPCFPFFRFSSPSPLSLSFGFLRSSLSPLFFRFLLLPPVCSPLSPSVLLLSSFPPASPAFLGFYL